MENPEKRSKAVSEDVAAAPSSDADEFPKRYGFANRVAQEEDVGIRGFLTPSAGYDGIMKQRYQDFIVRELDAHGNVVRLTSTALPPEPEAPAPMAAADALVQLRALAGDEFVAQIEAADAGGQRQAFTLEKELSKDDRTKVHTAIRNVFGGRVESSTKDGKLCISCGGAAIKGDFRSRDGRRSEANKIWPKERPDYLQFVLVKENVETNHAINELARGCRLNSKVFAWSGTKDKRAITAQLVTANRVAADKLVEGASHVRGIRVGNFAYVREGLRLGQGIGNAFDVALRFCSASAETLTDSVEQLRKYGFVNFYGLQRFGSTSQSTHVIGLALLRSEWHNAIDLIVSACVPSWSIERDARRGLKEVDERRNYGEKSILDALVRDPKDAFGAILKLPQNLRTLYIHAYQAYVWNVAVSERMSRGSKTAAEVGDLVLVSAGAAAADADGAEDGDVDLSFAANVKTAEEAQAHRIEDVLIPLPGTSVTLPTNFVGDVIRAQLAKDGVPLENWTAQGRRFPIKGGYRRVLCRPNNIAHQVVQYDKHDTQLVPTDVDLLDGKQWVPPSSGRYMGLRVSFELASGSYATMCFRELQKRPSDRAYQDAMQEKWRDELKRE